MAAATTASKQRGRPFPRGVSGNPRGRPRGARNAATIIAEQLLDGEVETLTRKAIEKAKRGDIVALRLCLDRILPSRRDRLVAFALPQLESPKDAAQAMAAIIQAVAAGSLTPPEAANLSTLIAHFTDALVAVEFEARLAALEKKQREPPA
jgi:hypothetical protein